jgi:methyl-accepting chemotaxis protein
MKLANLRTGKRLTLGFGILTALLLLVSAVSGWNMMVLNRSMDAGLRASGRMGKIKDVGTFLDGTYLDMYGLVTAKDPASKQSSKAALDADMEGYKKGMEELKSTAATQKGKELLAVLEKVVADSRDLNQVIIDKALKAPGLEATTMDLFTTQSAKYNQDKIDPAVQQLVRYQESRSQAANATAEAVYLEGRWALVLGTLVALVLSLVIGILITRSITAPVIDCIGFTGLLAQGDFSKDVPEVLRQRGDEMGDLAKAFHTMTADIRELLTELSLAVQTVASASTELSASTEEMAATTSQIAKTTDSQRGGSEQMSSAIAELSASIDEVSQSAQGTLKMMESALEATQRGDAAGGASQEAMSEIQVTAGQIAAAVTVITEIANQTNLLSLNAAIEAAKAGTQGKGFAVVAEEVRKLAEHSGASAKTIAEHIESARKAVGKGTATVTLTVDLLKQIRASLEQFAAQTRQVTVATMEQSRAGSEVARSVEKHVQEATATASATAQMSATTTEIARTVSDLARVADKLNGLAKRFRL